ncbi:MAG: hypothetical protein IJ493_03830 [Clostridia bacterium]|nr:hypothetical protein [Clostridia bacterium]
MEFDELPIGFAMALAQNQSAMQIFAAMSQTQKQAILSQAHNAQSKEEMHRLVSDLTNQNVR